MIIKNTALRSRICYSSKNLHTFVFYTIYPVIRVKSIFSIEKRKINYVSILQALFDFGDCAYNKDRAFGQREKNNTGF